ncbi:MAG: NAD-dependent epimerase/dehydratase family protein [Oscillospiraceae bacterium]|nr:NAD-dependent epimerase/dehydratase family protein [Oscillospiraceae bacterium]
MMMNILITGAAGFVGKNLTAALQNIRDGKDRTHPQLQIGELYLYDLDSPAQLLEEGCRNADFVFNLAGVNRPQNPEEFMQGNFGFASRLLETLKKYGNTCPVMLSSSIQATLVGRYAGGEYGKSKKAGEELFFSYGEETGAKVLVYRFPNLFGKWCRPNYNSAVATFCSNIANDLPITVNDPAIELELLYIDDLVDEMIAALEGAEHHCEFEGVETVLTEKGRYCAAPVSHKATLGQIVELLHSFRNQPSTLVMPEIPKGSFAKKLYSTYLSYLPREKVAFPLKMNVDARGSFTELLRTEKCGQFSVNISKPGITKGQHWHHTKWEFFIVVSGHGLIQQRRLGSDEVLNFEVSGEKIEAVHMLPGYTHNIINLSDKEDLVTLMWANEQFDPEKPDTFFEKV